MAQGTRGRWLRIATTGFGVLLCTGLVGCMNGEKFKDRFGSGKPTQGLPGTPKLDAAGNPIGGAKPGQTISTNPTGTFTGAGANIQPNNGFPPAGAGQSRFGTSGQNTNTSGSIPSVNYQQGASTGIGAPVQPGVQPVGGSTSGLPQPNWKSESTPSGPILPPPPPLEVDRLPPPSISGPGEFGSGGPVDPPVPGGPVAPIPPTKPGGLGGN